MLRRTHAHTTCMIFCLTTVTVGSVRVRTAVYRRSGGRDALVPSLGHKYDSRGDDQQHKYQASDRYTDREARLRYANTVVLVDRLKKQRNGKN